MDAIATIGALLGLGFVSGIRLYSTVLALGLGLRLGFFELPPALAHLDVLASLPVLIVAGVVYAIEFVADKIPFVDSMWDAVHTFIRPLGAAVIGATALGDVDPAVQLAAALACGLVAFSSHGAKATTRVAVNHSPEPFTNAGLSVAEDGLVLGGVWLALEHPLVALVVVVVLFVLCLWLVITVFRTLRRFLRELWHPRPTGDRLNS